VIERERKFLVADLPADLGPAAVIDQGYLALDGHVQVRLRRSDDEHTLTVKEGGGRDRTEVEVAITADVFDELWPITEGRRLQKDRHRVPLADGLTAEVDLYRGRLEGFLVVEVEFDDDHDPDTFDPPDWFGREVTGEGRFGNIALSTADGPPTT
jgi:CYTH domain-containing protein